MSMKPRSTNDPNFLSFFRYLFCFVFIYLFVFDFFLLTFFCTSGGNDYSLEVTKEWTGVELKFSPRSSLNSYTSLG